MGCSLAIFQVQGGQQESMPIVTHIGMLEALDSKHTAID